ncbi:hypothetical protein JL721_8147 [Aureococcus anophagefferens]|nr:hypothetical protein JL721_8147 [Aureococcus anophagefferens]
MCGPSSSDVRVKLEELLVEAATRLVKPYELRDTIRAVAVKQGKFADDESAMEQFIESRSRRSSANHGGASRRQSDGFDAHAVADVAPTNATLPRFADVREARDGARCADAAWAVGGRVRGGGRRGLGRPARGRGDVRRMSVAPTASGRPRLGGLLLQGRALAATVEPLEGMMEGEFARVIAGPAELSRSTL